MRSVEDADLALPRDVLVDAPQVVVGELLGRRDLERGDRAALRVERLHHLVDRAVLAGGIDPLEHDEHRALRLRPQAILEVAQALHCCCVSSSAEALSWPVGRARIEPSEADARTGLDPEGVAQVGRLADGRARPAGSEAGRLYDATYPKGDSDR